MQHVEPARRDPVAGGGVSPVEMRPEARVAPVFEAGKAGLLMDRDHRIAGEARVAVAGGEQHHVVAARAQALGEVPGVGFEPAREGRGDRVAEMGEERDPHAVRAASRASMARMTEAEFV